MSNMKALLTKKFYYLIRHPDAPNLSLRNYGERSFTLYNSQQGGYKLFPETWLACDPHWEINEENILIVGNALLEQVILREAREGSKVEEKAEKLDFFGPLKKFF